MKKIVLASGSPRRKELLKLMGFQFDVNQEYQRGLKSFLAKTLTEARVEEQEIFNYAYIKKILAANKKIGDYEEKLGITETDAPKDETPLAPTEKKETSPLPQ